MTLPALTAEEFRRLLLEFPDEPLHAMLITAACLGLRVSEITALQWGDFSPDGSTLTVRSLKRRHYDSLPVCPALMEVFTAFKSNSLFTRDTDWVFVDHGTLPYNSRHLQIRIRSAAQRAGLNGQVCWHALRQTLAVVLVSLGCDLSTIRRLMRHAGVQTELEMFSGTSKVQTTFRLSTWMFTQSPVLAADDRDTMARVASLLLAGTEMKHRNILEHKTNKPATSSN